MPSKYSFWSILLTIFSLILAFVFEWNPFGQVIGIDNTKRSQELLVVAKKNFIEKKFEKMLVNADKAYTYDNSIPALEYLGIALYLNKKFDSVISVFTDHEDKLTDTGKWILASSLSDIGRQKDAYTMFEKLDVESNPIEIRMESLTAYLNSAAIYSIDTLKYFSQNVINYANHEIAINSQNKIDILTTGKEIKLISFDANTYARIPGLYFQVGLLLFYNQLKKEHKISVEEEYLAMSYIEKGFSSGLLSYSISTYKSFFELINQVVTSMGTITKDMVVRLYIFKTYLQGALKHNILIGSGSFGKDFSDDNITKIGECIALIDATMPQNWESIVATFGQKKVDSIFGNKNQFKSKNVY